MRGREREREWEFGCGVAGFRASVITGCCGQQWRKGQ